MSRNIKVNRKIKIGVIPAAGAGVRLGYLSALLPKALFPLHDRPIIHYVVDQMQNIGIEKIYIIVKVKKEEIKRYFEMIKLDLKAEIEFIEQSELGGTAEAILLTEKQIKNEPFMVVYGDDCSITTSLSEMIANFFAVNPVVMEMIVSENNRKTLQQTCSVNLGKKGNIIEILEKPENPPYPLRGCGVYLFNPEIFKHIRETPVHPIRNEREITYTINQLAKLKKAYGYVADGTNININDYDELLRASQMLKLSRSKKTA
jgi:UDP-N-acetylglucosamine diphosphorylase / glucose-1-phosphate thymidylyltransferase / UDP-N-acetylgalactosamine diphosphorylase / glucosamine-1-phosphate N-acetyltransferase / galactosamine-1-phosphate N-acetyltransferase